jgi:hypothetical protein
MYQRGLQIEVNIATKPTNFLGLTLHCSKALPYDQYTEEDFAATIVGCEAFLVVCPCGAPAWKHPSTNRDGHCEICFMAKLDADFAEATRKETAAERKRDMRLFKQGYKFKVVAWVHPEAGDDYQIVCHHEEQPTTREVIAMLRKRGSRVLTDFRIQSMLDVLYPGGTIQ